LSCLRWRSPSQGAPAHRWPVFNLAPRGEMWTLRGDVGPQEWILSPRGVTLFPRDENSMFAPQFF
jgi:hypothetical protein